MAKFRMWSRMQNRNRTAAELWHRHAEVVFAVGFTQTHPRQSQSSQFSSCSIQRRWGTFAAIPGMLQNTGKSAKEQQKNKTCGRSARENGKSGRWLCQRRLWVIWSLCIASLAREALLRCCSNLPTRQKS